MAGGIASNSFKERLRKLGATVISILKIGAS